MGRGSERRVAGLPTLPSRSFPRRVGPASAWAACARPLQGGEGRPAAFSQSDRPGSGCFPHPGDPDGAGVVGGEWRERVCRPLRRPLSHAAHSLRLAAGGSPFVNVYQVVLSHILRVPFCEGLENSFLSVYLTLLELDILSLIRHVRLMLCTLQESEGYV